MTGKSGESAMLVGTGSSGETRTSDRTSFSGSERPTIKPSNPFFSSGPTTKYPGWSLSDLQSACLGRSHRSVAGKQKLAAVLDEMRRLLGLPDNYRIGIVPGSDTGAVELAMWSLLGPRPVSVIAWESFGNTWLKDITDQLKLPDIHLHQAEYGRLPDLAAVDPGHDIVFTWNGTTSGVMVPDADWIAEDRGGLTLCDATSAAFAMPLPFDKLDVVTFSWQKALGGEAAHGVLILSPRAVARLASYTPPWPMPKLFRLTAKGMVNEAIFTGATINTPSMLCVEDALAALRWAKDAGGSAGLFRRVSDNLTVVRQWLVGNPRFGFLAERAETISPTSICLKITDQWFAEQQLKDQQQLAKALAARLEVEEVGYDLGAYRDAPPGIRIWGGPTVETADIAALLPWLDWCWEDLKKQQQTG